MINYNTCYLNLQITGSSTFLMHCLVEALQLLICTTKKREQGWNVREALVVNWIKIVNNDGRNL